MSGYHVRIELFSQTNGRDDRVQEYGRLRYFGLLQFFIRTAEHDVCDAES